MRILKLLSHFTGKLAGFYLPVWLRGPLYLLYARIYHLNILEAEYDLSGYKSFAEFFTRNLKTGLRPISNGLVSPADALFLDAGKIESQRLIGIKGCSYLVADLLGSEDLSNKFLSGSFYNFYLAPGDYHHVHSPVSGEIVSRIYIPGSLYPVSRLFVKLFSDLYIRQERVSTVIKDAKGNLHAVIMVGAFNVGSMGLSYDSNFMSNRLNAKPEKNIKEYNQNLAINAGDKLGTFHLGSTVVVLNNIQFDLSRLKIELGSKVKYGQMVQDL